MGVIERALQLAGSGSFRKLDEIAHRLKREGHVQVDAHLSGSSVRKDLNRLMKAANSPAAT